MDGSSSRDYVGKDLEAMTFAVQYHQWILSEFEPYLGNSAAEVGAGTGNFTKLLVDRVTQLEAFEPSRNMYQALARQYADSSTVNTHNTLFEHSQPQFAQSFDSVIYVNVMEHVENDAHEFSIINSGLVPGGYALIFVPALSWLYSDFDRQVGHYRRYHKKDLRNLAMDAGFEIIKLKYFDVFGILPWYLAFVTFKKSVSQKNVALYDKWIAPVAKKVERIVSPPVGKNLLLVAKKI